MLMFKKDYTAKCKVYHKKTKDLDWVEFETIEVKANSIENLMERLNLYTGRPEKRKDVQAVKLVGTIQLLKDVKHSFYDHVENISLDVNIIKELY